MSKDFSKVLEDAEKQVSGIKDAKFREIAFSKLVSHLLDGSSSEDDAETTKPKAQNKGTRNKSTKPVASKPKAAKSKERISLVKNLNLREKGKKSFKAFYDEKKPSSAMEFNTVAVYYLSQILEQEKTTPNHVYTCYKEVNKRPPIALHQSLRDTAHLKGYIDTSDTENLTIPSRGINFVEHDLPKKKDGK